MDVATPGIALDPREAFDAAFYREAYPDVAEAGVDPWDHFQRHGEAQGRRPTAWFDPAWYRSRYLAPLRSPGEEGGAGPSAFEHFCRFGNVLGLLPSPEAEQQAYARLGERLDRDFYLRIYEDVAAAGIDPLLHYRLHGWREGRDPAPWFATLWYGETHLLASEAARAAGGPALAKLIDPFVHFLRLGEARGLRTRPRPGAASRDASLGDLVAALADEPRAAALPADDADLLMGSPWFDTAHYARLSGVAGDRRALVEHHLRAWRDGGPDPSPAFGGAFYRRTYGTSDDPGAGPGTLPPALAEIAYAGDVAPLVHWLRTGRTLGFYPNPQVAAVEIETIRAAGTFSERAYRAALKAPPALPDPVADYAVYGHLAGANPFPHIDPALLRDLYVPLTGEDMFAPYAFYLRWLHRPWMVGSAPQLRAAADAVRRHPLFDAAAYADRAGLGDTPVDPAEHYVVAGQFRATPPGPGFDPAFYLAANADLEAARVDLLAHYWDHGRGENRRGAASEIADLRPLARRRHDPALPSVLVVSHEASRTGAPIVALNLARRLSATHNVVVWIGDPGGPLVEAFGASAVELWGGWASARDLESAFAAIVERTGCDLAFVNSVVSQPAIVPLRAQGVPVVSLIHEFANYVWPQSTLSRAVLYSDVAVFPARMVWDACLRELDAIGAVAAPAHVRIQAQGANAANAGEPDIDEAQIAARLGIDPDRAAREAAPRPVRVMFGAGQVQFRKGLDLFVQTASRLLEDDSADWRFIWVGGGYDPTRDPNLSAHVEYQIRSSGLAGRLFMFGEQRSLDPFWSLCDVFLLSSRLDPFPNVVLDAWEARRPVVCFSGATGVAELAPDFPFAVRPVPYADPAAAALAVSEAGRQSAAIQAAFAGPEGQALAERTSFEGYVESLMRLGEEARAGRDRRLAVEAELGRLTPRALRRAAARVPALARLPGTDDASVRQTIVRQMQEDSFATGLRLEPGSGMLTSTEGNPVCDARLGGVGAPADLRGHVLHLHLERAEAAALLQVPLAEHEAARAWPLQALRRARVVLTAEDPQLLRELGARVPPGMELVPRVFLGALEALDHVQAATDPGPESAGPGASLTHLSLGRDPGASVQQRLRAEVFDLLAGLVSGATLQALEEDAGLLAVAPRPRGGGGHIAVRPIVERLAASQGLEPPEPGSTAPRLMGTYRRTALAGFLAAWLPTLRREGAPLDAPDQSTLAAYALALHARAQGGRLAHLLETAV